MPPFKSLPTPEEFLAKPQKAICVIGMSGVGKTHLARRLRAGGGWFHYSVDYRIGTRYMGEHIVDSFKREAMKTPMLRDLLLSDSIYIANNITFENLAPLSIYLGKPGDPEKGGLPFDEYLRRQRQHHAAETAAMLDAAAFIDKARGIYGYDHFLCDASGSFVEIVDPTDPNDPVLQAVAEHMLLVYIQQGPGDADELAARFDQDPKPMYYEEGFLKSLWRRHLDETGRKPEQVDPDAFIRWGFRALIAHRTPRYHAIAANWGVTLEKDAVAAATTEQAFCAAVADGLAQRMAKSPATRAAG
ncbi:MAG: ATPase [Pseudomonadota bacterium]